MTEFQSTTCGLLLVVIVLIAVQPAVTHLNVFITQSEVMKLLGLNAELFYVRDGVVNTYAMNFVVLVPAHISDLEFSWQSLTKHPNGMSVSVWIAMFQIKRDLDLVWLPQQLATPHSKH
ncbi:derailed [Carabus blaptoides fortunei]